MEHGADGSMLRDLLILLAAALVFVLIFRRLGLGATLGYLIAGALVGPQMMGLVGGGEDIIVVAEFGIVLLLFVVGLELNPARLWRMKNAIFGLGLAQVLLCGVAMTAVIWAAAAYPFAAALALGLPLGLSSTAQVLPMLQSSGRLRTPFGERAFAILLFQDLSIIPLITIVTALSVRETGTGGPEGWALAGLTLLAVAGLILAGRFLLRPLFRLIGGLGEREMFVVAGLFTVVASAALMEALGMSTALGAFIAGVMLADTPYRHELEADIEPFRSILLGLFFLAIGMTLDLGAVLREPGFIILMAAALVTVKTALIFGLGLFMKMGWRAALALGLLLSQGGEFGFVLFTQAQGGGIISAETASLFGAVVTLSMATTPFLMMATRRIRSGGKDSRTRQGPSADGASALIIGYGRFGQTVGQMLMLSGIRVSLIDRKVDQIDLADEFGTRVHYGDGLRLDLLRQAGAGEAALICFCVDGDQLEAQFLRSVREAFPDAAIMVRAFDRRTVMKLAGTGYEYLVREVRESAVAMGRAALEYVGVGQGEVKDLEADFRENDRLRLKDQIDGADLHAGDDRIIRPQQKA